LLPLGADAGCRWQANCPRSGRSPPRWPGVSLVRGRSSYGRCLLLSFCPNRTFGQTNSWWPTRHSQMLSVRRSNGRLQRSHRHKSAKTPLLSPFPVTPASSLLIFAALPIARGSCAVGVTYPDSTQGAAVKPMTIRPVFRTMHQATECSGLGPGACYVCMGHSAERVDPGRRCIGGPCRDL
jgi:hypothetical protein